MYLEHFGLKRKPFSKTPDPAFLFPSRQHAEALARLAHALEEREVAVLTGEVGAGKTMLSRALVDQFADRCRFSLVVNPALPPAQLLEAIAGGFGLPPARRKAETYGALAEHAARLDEQGVFPVVLIDEAQLLAGRTAFDELRLLTNLTLDDRALLGIVLIGQPELRDRVRKKGGEAFAQRVGVAYHVGPLDAADTGEYLAHRLRVGGREAPLFTPEAAAAIHRASGGIPRRINQICDVSLMTGMTHKSGKITDVIVDEAVGSLEK
jgi:type II secretory pathway predicted ATPase ExeA